MIIDKPSMTLYHSRNAVEQILWLIKLWQLYNASFIFFSLEEFEISFPNGVHFSGSQLIDVLYIW